MNIQICFRLYIHIFHLNVFMDYKYTLCNFAIYILHDSNCKCNVVFSSFFFLLFFFFLCIFCCFGWSRNWSKNFENLNICEWMSEWMNIWMEKVNEYDYMKLIIVSVYYLFADFIFVCFFYSSLWCWISTYKRDKQCRSVWLQCRTSYILTYYIYLTKSKLILFYSNEKQFEFQYCAQCITC